MERDTHYFAANGIKADTQKDMLLCCISRDTFGLLRTLAAPAKPGEETYKELVDVLNNIARSVRLQGEGVILRWICI